MSARDLNGIRDAIEDPKFSHSRSRHWCGAWLTYIYHRDPESPSGVKLAAAGDAVIVDPIIREIRNTSPLSPTEGL